MKVALLASMRIEVVFDQSPPMNGITFKIACNFCGKIVFEDTDDDDKDFVSSFGTLEDAMLSLPMACYYHRLVVVFCTKLAMQRNLSQIGCFILYQEKKNLILITLDFALLTIPSWILVLEMINILYLQ